MKQVLIGVFAHPDDEAFGPSGTLLALADKNVDVHLILLTRGEGGVNGTAVANLGEARLNEWLHAAEVLGATSTCAHAFPDGKLQNIPPSELDMALQTDTHEVIRSYNEPIELSVMTFEPTGLTGHLDHIAASDATTRLFKSLAGGMQPQAHELWYYCLNSAQAPLEGTAYYEPRAREDNYITRSIDTSAFLAKKYQVIDCHASQYRDAANLKALGDTLLSTECFRVLSATDLES